MKTSYPDIPLAPVCKQAAFMLSSQDPNALDTSGVRLELTSQMLELDEAIASMETQLVSDRSNPAWRRQCQFNLRLAKNAKQSLVAATNCITSCVKHMEATKRHEQSLEDIQEAREAKERRISIASSEQHESFKVLTNYLRTTHGDTFYFETLFAAGLLKKVKFKKAAELPIHLRDKVDFILPARWHASDQPRMREA
jgi:hypothetical protein